MQSGVAAASHAAPIIVVSAVDQHYLPLLEVVATSIAANATSGRPVEYHAIYAGPETRQSRRIERWRRGAVQMHLHRVENPYARFAGIGSVPSSTFLRFTIERLLSQHERAIYLDADLVVETDLAPLFDAPLDGNPIGAVASRTTAELALAPNRTARGDKMYDYLGAIIGLETDERKAQYMEAGVLLLDLDALRAMNYAGLAEATIERLGPALHFADQSAMNIVLRDRITAIDPRWNVMPATVMPGSIERALPQFRHHAQLQHSAAWIWHFAHRKPWRRLGLPGGRRWWRYAWMSGLGLHFTRSFVVDRTRLELANLRKRRNR